MASILLRASQSSVSHVVIVMVVRPKETRSSPKRLECGVRVRRLAASSSVLEGAFLLERLLFELLENGLPPVPPGSPVGLDLLLGIRLVEALEANDHPVLETEIVDR